MKKELNYILTKVDAKINYLNTVKVCIVLKARLQPINYSVADFLLTSHLLLTE